jgi:glyoxylase I family protein
MRQRTSAIDLQGIHHVSINVEDVNAALAFYVDVLGLTPLPRPDMGFPGAWLRAGNQEIHLLGLSSGTPVKEQHFAFQVKDVDAVATELRQLGHSVSKVSEIQGICRQIFSHDPSGNMVEFNQRL